MKNVMLFLLCLAVIFAVQSFAVEHELASGGEVDKFVTNSFPLQKMVEGSLNKSANTASVITPICPTLAVGNLYTLSNPQVGESICYHFEIVERSKITALLVNQSAATNVDLSIIRHNSDDTFTVIGVSANTDNQDEVVIALTEPGHYYWFMEVAATDGSSFGFGTAVASNLDEYEFNDTLATATILPDRQNTIVGNMDSISDIDYYQFTAVRGQELSILLLDGYSSEYIFEIYNNGWVPVPVNTYQTISGLQPNQQITLRVRANTALQANPNNSYTLSIASIVASFEHTVGGESNVIRIPYSAFSSPYLTTQAYHVLNWSLVLKDSTGAPIEGGTAVFRFIKDLANAEETLTNYEKVSDANGVISEGISLGRCNPNIPSVQHTEYSFGYRNVWESDVEVGAWRIEIPTNRGLNENGQIDTIGVGGDSVPFVIFGHICDQDLISSNPA